MVRYADHGDSGDAFDLPDRRGRGVECAGVVSAVYSDPEILWQHLRWPGSADDGGAGCRVAVWACADADRRRGQAGEVVLRAEAESAAWVGRASDGWSG